jgi:hypothetical protein
VPAVPWQEGIEQPLVFWVPSIAIYRQPFSKLEE